MKKKTKQGSTQIKIETHRVRDTAAQGYRVIYPQRDKHLPESTAIEYPEAPAWFPARRHMIAQLPR